MKTLEEIYEKIKDKVATNFENDCITVTFGHYTSNLCIRLGKNEKGNYDLEINNIHVSNMPFRMARSKFMKALDVFC